jgi:hypothetical protein
MAVARDKRLANPTHVSLLPGSLAHAFWPSGVMDLPPAPGSAPAPTPRTGAAGGVFRLRSLGRARKPWVAESPTLPGALRQLLRRWRRATTFPAFGSQNEAHAIMSCALFSEASPRR